MKNDMVFRHYDVTLRVPARIFADSEERVLSIVADEIGQIYEALGHDVDDNWSETIGFWLEFPDWDVSIRPARKVTWWRRLLGRLR